MRIDFDSIPDGAEVTLYPGDNNPLHSSPIKAVYAGGYFYCEGTHPADGPDYYWRDVGLYCAGFTLEAQP